MIFYAFFSSFGFCCCLIHSFYERVIKKEILNRVHYEFIARSHHFIQVVIESLINFCGPYQIRIQEKIENW